MNGTVAVMSNFVRPAARRRADALTTREVDGLVSRLLREINIPFAHLGKRALNQLMDLKNVLLADYVEGISLPPKPLLKELAQVVETEIGSRAAMLNRLDSGEFLGHFGRIFGPREIELRAQPYRKGAGLALRGFFCRASLGRRNKFVIFVNTAHHPGAVAATLGHELGHYIYGSWVGESAPMVAFMEGTFAGHLNDEDELFADSLVALSAYSRDVIRQIGPLNYVGPGASDEAFARIRKAYELIGPRFNLDLAKGRMASACRVRYLTSMTHFFRLRCALLRRADL